MMSRIFDQSAHGNHLHVTGRPDGLGVVAKGGRLFQGRQVTGTNASADLLRVDGHRVYSAYFEGGMGFRTNSTRGIPTGDEPETIYMVASGKHYNDNCCFDVSANSTSVVSSLQARVSTTPPRRAHVLVMRAHTALPSMRSPTHPAAPLHPAPLPRA